MGRRRVGRRAAGARGGVHLGLSFFFSTLPTTTKSGGGLQAGSRPPGGGSRAIAGGSGASPSPAGGPGASGPPVSGCADLGARDAAPASRLAPCGRPPVLDGGHELWRHFPLRSHAHYASRGSMGSAAAGFWGRGGSHPDDRDQRLPHNRLEPPPRPLSPPGGPGLAVSAGHAAVADTKDRPRPGTFRRFLGIGPDTGGSVRPRGLCSRTAKADVSLIESLNIPCTAPARTGCPNEGV